jgi:para-aminobenzoate synthetase / 4-amino-4-deoxychorismate lyase
MTPMPSRPQPDPAQGVFETMLVVHGTPVLPEAHLSRLESSVRAVYGTELPGDTRRKVAERAADLELGRVRLTFAPPTLEIEAGEVNRSLHFPEGPIALRSHPVNGGLGCHKWADRSTLPPCHTGEAALLVDGAEVLEADRANVFGVHTGAIFTPPLDGRILPGVTRATVIELAREEDIEVIERPLSVEQLAQSDEVFLTNSIRGIEAVVSIDGTHLGGERSLTGLLTDALRNKWKSGAAAPEGGRSLTA